MSSIQNLRLLPFFLFLFLFSACQKSEMKQSHESTLRIAMEDDPSTLDPRSIRGLSATTTLHMLYEGLMRVVSDGTPSPALAEAVTLSPDRKTYTFHLRKSAWSDGTPVTAYDFERTWKSQLEPHFLAPNAYQFYVIKGARAAKEGQGSRDDIGVRALDPSTLIVELERPVPYFLHLTAAHFLFPVHASSFELIPLKEGGADRTEQSSQPITNGPFKLEKWDRHNELTAIPNPHYWDRQNIRIGRIEFIHLDSSAALQLFEKGELDWTGSPTGTLPSDALESLKKEGKLAFAEAAGVYLLRINTEKDPFTHEKMRKAFGLAINRRDLVEHVLQGGQRPAFGLIPPSFMEEEFLFEDSNEPLARRLFDEALEEMGLTLENFPKLEISYASNERAHKIAQVIQQQWKKNLKVQVSLQSTEPKVYFDRLKKGDYQIGIGNWFADFCDPISFLEIFKYKKNGTNNTQWENSRFIELLDQTALTADPADRKELLKEAQRLLIEEMPAIPLFYSTYLYLKNPSVKGVYFSELGYLDFKNAYFLDLILPQTPQNRVRDVKSSFDEYPNDITR